MPHVTLKQNETIYKQIMCKYLYFIIIFLIPVVHLYMYCTQS